MDHENQQYVRTRRRTSRDRPRNQSAHNRAPRRDDVPLYGGDHGRGQSQYSRSQAPQDDGGYYSEDEYAQPLSRDERAQPHRHERAPSSYSERPPPAPQARGREGPPRSEVTREYMSQALDSRRQAQYEQRPNRMEREWVSMAGTRGPPPDPGSEHSRRDQSAMPAPLNIQRQGLGPEMRRGEQVRGRFPFQINNGLNADFERSMLGVQTQPGPFRSELAVGGGDAGETGLGVVGIETSCPNCGFCFRRSYTQQPQPYAIPVQELHAKTTCDLSQSRKQTEQPFATPVPSRIPILKDTSNGRESQLPFPSAALPRAMQSGAMGNLPARLWPTSSKVPQRPDSPYPGDPAVQTRRVYSSTTIPRRLPTQIPTVPTGNISRLRMRESMIPIQAQRPPCKRAERNLHANSQLLQSPRLIHPSRQPRGPPQSPECSRPDGPLVAAPDVVQGSKRDDRHRSIQAEDVIDESLLQPQSGRRLPNIGELYTSRIGDYAASTSRINVSPPSTLPAVGISSHPAPSRRVSLTSKHLPHHPELAQSLSSLQMQEAAAWGCR